MSAEWPLGPSLKVFAVQKRTRAPRRRLPFRTQLSLWAGVRCGLGGCEVGAVQGERWPLTSGSGSTGNRGGLSVQGRQQA